MCDLQAYQAQVVLAEAEEAFDGNDIPVDPWTFSGALLYSITVITTIGRQSTIHSQGPRSTP